MCGIAGLIGAGDESTVRGMCSLLRHRGPDDDGFYADEHARLGMVRLSIIDLAGGRQPMSDERGRHHLVFNGEIYNYQPLREALVAQGHTLRSRSDTEVLVHLFEDRRERCLDALNGDFAFAVWDREERRLFLARDRVGVKPLYYWHDGDRFAFASELKALLALPQVPREIDVEALDDYLTFLYIPSPRTIFTHVKKLPPGCWLSFAGGEVHIERYWRPTGGVVVPRRAGDLEEELLQRLREAVRVRLMSDVPLGAFLSGGIDSSAVVALMSQLSDRPVKTFSLGFGPPDDSFNELPAARLAATAFHTEHREFIVQPDVAGLLPSVVEHLDEPFADSSSLLTFIVSREARRHATVALTGIGGDELFGGYVRYLGARASLGVERLPLVLRRGLAAAAAWLPESPTSQNLGGHLKRFARGCALPADARYVSWISQMDRASRAALYTPETLRTLGGRDAAEVFCRLLGQLPGSYLDRIGLLDLETYLPDDLLMLGDKMSMAHGLEVRVPFCDHHLIEAVCAVPMRRRLEGGQLKGMLRRMLRGLLPEPLLHKRKQGFMLPLSRWLRGPLDPLCRELLSASRISRRGWFRPEAVEALVSRHRAGASTLAHQVYALLVLELWAQRYLDQPVRR